MRKEEERERKRGRKREEREGEIGREREREERGKRDKVVITLCLYTLCRLHVISCKCGQERGEE